MTLKRSTAGPWAILARNDWGDILELARKKSFRRKFQLVEAFVHLVATHGILGVNHGMIAEACSVTRQLVDHHFPSQRSLLALTYRYIYARFQKHGSDALVSRAGPLNQFKAYVLSIPDWVRAHHEDARFLVQYFAICPVDRELLALFDRNIEIGQQRILALLTELRQSGQVPDLSDEALRERALSLQKQIAGFVVIESTRKAREAKSVRAKRDELLRSCMAVIGLKT